MVRGAKQTPKPSPSPSFRAHASGNAAWSIRCEGLWMPGTCSSVPRPSAASTSFSDPCLRDSGHTSVTLPDWVSQAGSSRRWPPMCCGQIPVPRRASAPTTRAEWVCSLGLTSQRWARTAHGHQRGWAVTLLLLGAPSAVMKEGCEGPTVSRLSVSSQCLVFSLTGVPPGCSDELSVSATTNAPNPGAASRPEGTTVAMAPRSITRWRSA